jgi:phospholipase C
MNSPSWNDSVFFLTYDEPGGTYDHVPALTNVPSPDGIPPQDLNSNDIPGDFTRTGFRVPLIVVSPFTVKNLVSHTPMDYTAVLKFVETRFNLPPLTARDSAMPDMTEFFDFVNPPWMTPPSPPAQNMNGACYLDHLP